MLSLELNQDPKNVYPGQKITGTLAWELEAAPEEALLRLFWYTEGRGDQDIDIVYEYDVNNGMLQNRGNFEFTVPASPYSCKGKYVSICWAIELVLNKGKQVERLDLQVSPWTSVVTLNEVE